MTVSLVIQLTQANIILGKKAKTCSNITELEKMSAKIEINILHIKYLCYARHSAKHFKKITAFNSTNNLIFSFKIFFNCSLCSTLVSGAQHNDQTIIYFTKCSPDIPSTYLAPYTVIAISLTTLHPCDYSVSISYY